MNERARMGGTIDKEVDLDDLVAQADTGARNPTGTVATFLFAVALAWSLFQLWIASPLPFMVGFGVFNDTEARSIHLAFAIFLAFTAYPALSKSPRDYIPVQDWIFAVLGAFAAAYLYLFYESLSSRPGAPITQDYVVAVDRHDPASGSDPPLPRPAPCDHRDHLSGLHLRRPDTCPRSSRTRATRWARW